MHKKAVEKYIKYKYMIFLKKMFFKRRCYGYERAFMSKEKMMQRRDDIWSLCSKKIRYDDMSDISSLYR